MNFKIWLSPDDTRECNDEKPAKNDFALAPKRKNLELKSESKFWKLEDRLNNVEKNTKYNCLHFLKVS